MTTQPTIPGTEPAPTGERALLQFAADNLAPQVLHIEADTGDEPLDARLILVPAGMKVLTAALRETALRCAGDTKLPVYYGTPE